MKASRKRRLDPSMTGNANVGCPAWVHGERENEGLEEMVTDDGAHSGSCLINLDGVCGIGDDV